MALGPARVLGVLSLNAPPSTWLQSWIIIVVCVHSWNLGPVHMVSLSTEVYFYLEFGPDLLFKQYEWLRQDLEVNGSIK